MSAPDLKHRSRRRASIVRFMLSAAMATAALLTLGAEAFAQGVAVSDNIVVTVTASAGAAPLPPPPIPLKPRVSPSLTSTFRGFADTTASNSACPATSTPAPSRTPTGSPSVSPSVLGVTFDSPSPSPSTAPSKSGGKLPFTGLPLTHLFAVASALFGAGLVLVRSKRRHRLSRH